MGKKEIKNEKDVIRLLSDKTTFEREVLVATFKIPMGKVSTYKRIAEKVEDNCRQAAYLAQRVQKHPDLELSAPVALNIVCFRYFDPSKSEVGLNELNSEIVMDLQEQGIAAPSTTKINNQVAIRVNITNHRTTHADMDILINSVTEAGRSKL